MPTSKNAYQEHFNELREITQHTIKFGTSKEQLMQYHYVWSDEIKAKSERISIFKSFYYLEVNIIERIKCSTLCYYLSLKAKNYIDAISC